MNIRIIDFMFFSKYVEKLLFLFLIVNLINGLYFAFIVAPTDYEQYESYRIIYIHVPSAWMCLINYLLITVLSILYLLYKNPLFIISSINLAYTGTIFTLITLFTGSI